MHGEEPASSDPSEDPRRTPRPRRMNTIGGEAGPPSPGADLARTLQSSVTPEAEESRPGGPIGEDGRGNRPWLLGIHACLRTTSGRGQGRQSPGVQDRRETSSRVIVRPPPADTEPQVTMQQYAHVAGPGHLWRELDDFEKTVDSPLQFSVVAIGSVGTIASGFTVGYVFGCCAAGCCCRVCLAAMPAWTLFDPLAIVSTGGGIVGDDQDGGVARGTRREPGKRSIRDPSSGRRV